MKILLIEDDARLGPLIARLLTAERHTVQLCATGADGISFWESASWDLIILDRMLPDLEGSSILRDRRHAGDTTPVLMLTARDGLEDRVKGLDLGADDYLTKPYDLPELEARVRALIRRGQSGGGAELIHGDLSLDTAGRRATIKGSPLDLSARELGVLEVLMLRVGRVVSKEQLAEQLYGWGEEVGTNAIEVYVHRLRKKIGTTGLLVRTHYGRGYALDYVEP